MEVAETVRQAVEVIWNGNQNMENKAMKRMWALAGTILLAGLATNGLAAEETAAKGAESAKVPVVSGFGNVALGGMLQVWFVNDPTKEFSKGSTDDATFRVRRAEIKASGDIIPSVGFNVMADLAKYLKINTTTNTTGAVTGASPDQSSTVLQDATINLKLAKMVAGLDSIAPGAELWIGQQKPGITEEGPRSSSKLEFPERSQIARTYADKRDIGLMLKDTHSYVDYTVGLFNGSGMNTVDNNSDKAVAWRVGLKPLTGIKVGTSGSTGKSGVDETDQDRYGFDTQLELGPCTLKAEYLQGRDASTDFEGYYVQPGFFIIPNTLQMVGRYDSYDRNTDKSSDTVEEFTGGMNYFFSKHNAKVMVDYMRRNNKASTDENIILVGLQAAY